MVQNLVHMIYNLITLVPRDSAASSGLHGHQAYTWCLDKRLTHKIQVSLGLLLPHIPDMQRPWENLCHKKER